MPSYPFLRCGSNSGKGTAYLAVLQLHQMGEEFAFEEIVMHLDLGKFNRIINVETDYLFSLEHLFTLDRRIDAEPFAQTYGNFTAKHHLDLF